MNQLMKVQSVFSSLLRTSLVVMLGFLAVACSTHGSKPTTLLTQAEQKVQSAKSHDAEEHAPLALEKAKEHLSKAKDQISEEEYDEASRDLELAIAYSDYAVMKSDADQKEKAANEISQGLMNLQRETLN